MSEEQICSEPLFNAGALKSVVKSAMRELIEEAQLRIDADDTARQLAEIEVKQNITIAEAVMLYRCSDDFLYDRIKEAEKKKTLDPVPFQWCGVYTFPHTEFKTWLARQTKPQKKRQKKVA